MSSLRLLFGRRLRFLRCQRDMTQEQLAEAIETSVEFVSLIERGINAPSFNTLEKLAEVLKVSYSELFTFLSEK